MKQLIATTNRRRDEIQCDWIFWRNTRYEWQSIAIDCAWTGCWAVIYLGFWWAKSWTGDGKMVCFWIWRGHRGYLIVFHFPPAFCRFSNGSFALNLLLLDLEVTVGLFFLSTLRRTDKRTAATHNALHTLVAPISWSFARRKCHMSETMRLLLAPFCGRLCVYLFIIILSICVKAEQQQQ